MRSLAAFIAAALLGGCQTTDYPLESQSTSSTVVCVLSMCEVIEKSSGIGDDVGGDVDQSDKSSSEMGEEGSLEAELEGI